MDTVVMEGFELSPQQKRLFDLQQDGGNYHGHLTLTIEGVKDRGEIREAIRKVVARHEILRTTFRKVEGVAALLQFISQTPDFIWEEAESESWEDASNASAPTAESFYREGPPLRAYLKVWPGNRCVLHLLLPSLCADAVSLKIIAQEIAEQLEHAHEAPQEPPSVQYIHFSEWQNQLLEAGEAPTTNGEEAIEDGLKIGRKIASPSETSQGAFSVDFNAEILSKVRAVSAGCGVTPSTFVLACWQLLLWRRTQAAEIVIGAVLDGRQHDESLANVVGPFATYVPLKFKPTRGQTFSEFLLETQAVVSHPNNTDAAFALQHLVHNVGAGNGNRTKNGNGPTHLAVGFDYEEYQQKIGSRISLDRAFTAIEKFKIRLAFASRASGSKESGNATLHYDPSVIARTEVAEMAEQFHTLVFSACGDPDCAIETVNLLSEAQLKRTVYDFNRTASPRATEPAIAIRFEDQVGTTPNETAVVCGDEKCTYAELNARANQLAHYLRECGIGPDKLVAICITPSPAMVVAIMAVLKSGGAYVPLDPAYPKDRINFVLENANCSVVLTEEKLEAKVNSGMVRTFCVDRDWEKVPATAENPTNLVSPSNLAYVIYTSGSTGKPKGVMVTHEGVLNYLDWCAKRYGFSGSQVALHSSISFDLTVTALLFPLMSGKKIRLVPESSSHDALAKTLDEHDDFSFVKLTPAHFKLLSRQIPAEKIAKATKALLVGGEALFFEDLAPLEDQICNVAILNEYGPTETVVGCCVYQAPAETGHAGPVPIGKPIINTQLYVLDTFMRPVAPGVEGELHIGGAGVARGYLANPSLTAEKFVPDCFGSAGGRLYKTGDLVRMLSDGELEYIGRRDTQVKIRGFRIELDEIQTALQEHPAVAAAAVVAREDTSKGKHLIAYVVYEGGQEVKSITLREFLESKLPRYMVPASFIQIDELPLTSNGKVDRNALPSPEDRRPLMDAAYRAPISLEEEVLTGVWSQVLGIDHVGIDDNYFALGGDSIRSIQVVARAKERGLTFSVDDLFSNPTIHLLATLMASRQGGNGVEAPAQAFAMISEDDRKKVPSHIEDAYPLSRLQAGMIFHREYDSGSAIYHDISSFYLKAPLKLEALSTALYRLIERHPALRTSFDLTHFSQPLQLVHKDPFVPLQIEDLTHLEFQQQEEAIACWFNEEKQKSFDFAKLPLIRFCVHKRGENRWQFALSFHHAILDGWSEATMLTEMFHQYLVLAQGEEVHVDAPAILFRKFVALEQDVLSSEEARQFWERKLSGSSLAKIPRWANQPIASEREIIVKEVPISPEISDGLKKLALTSSVMVKNVLMAAHMRVMSLLSGQTDVLSCMVASGRPEDKDGDRLLGLFINSMPIRVDLSGGTWSDLVTATFAAEREALPYRRYPMSELKRMVGGRALSETLFYFTHYHVYQSLQKFKELEVLGGQLYEETSFVIASNFRIDPFTSRVYLTLKCDGTQLSREQVNVISGYYHKVLELMATQPNSRFETACLLSDEEIKELKAGSAEPVSDYSQVKDQCIHQQFEKQVEKAGETVAATCDGVNYTYGELNRRANQLARYLRNLGVGPETHVGLCVDRSLDTVVAILGILKAGGGYVPLDPKYPKDRISFMLKDAGISVLVSQQAHIGQLPENQAMVVCIDTAWESIAKESEENLLPVTTPANLAYIIYTSGSTGQPKGTLVTHAHVNRLFAATDHWYNFNAQDVWTLFHSYAFDFSVWEIWGALLYGGRLVVVPHVVARSPEAFYELLCKEKVTVLNQTPSAFRQLMQTEGTLAEPGNLALRFVIFGGEALEMSSLKPWFDRHGDQKPQLVNMYGITETTVHVTYKPLSKEDLESGSCIGIPIPDLQVHILDRNMQPVPIGVVGELYVGGPGVSRGYWQKPSLTASRFIPNPFGRNAGDRLYKTGDQGRFLPDRTIEYTGRGDNQVKIRGFRIELGEIEAALNNHPQIRDVVVVVHQDPSGDKKLIAHCVLEEGVESLPNDLRGFVRKTLPDYMTPAIFAPIVSIPITAQGKVDRAALPVPGTERPEVETCYLAPKTSREEVLERIWASSLQIDRVGVNDNFFELGGHSLIATQLVALVRDAFQINLPVRALYDSPTISRLAETIEDLVKEGKNKPEQYQPIATIIPDQKNRYQPFPLTEIQQAYWVGRNQGFELGDMPAHIYLEFEAVGLDIPRLQTVLRKLIQRHDMLRAIVLPDGTQQILEKVPAYEIGVTDLRGQEVEQVDSHLQVTRKRMSHQMFISNQWPLFEVKANRLEGDRTRLHFSIDLLITDADSLGILNRELGLFYLNPEAELPPLALSFRDYVLGELQLRDSDHYKKSKEYWLERIPHIPPSPSLSMVKSFEAVVNKRFSRFEGILNKALWKKLKTRAAKAGITPSGLLMATYSEALAAWSRSPRFTINVTTYNCLPLHPEAKDLVGDFTSLTLLAVNSSQNTFEERAKAVQRQFLDDIEHNYFGGIQVIRELGRAQNNMTSASMPVVFTSTLPLHTREGDRKASIPVELVAGITQSPQTLLDHQVSEVDGDLTIRWDYIEELFPAGMMKSMFGGYERMLRALAEEEGNWSKERLDGLLLGEQLEERAAINATGTAIPEGLLHEGFLKRAEERPEATAVVSGRRRISYGQLLQEANHVAVQLRELGVESNELVAVVMEKGWEQIVGVLGILQSGGAYLPIEAGLPQARREQLLEQGGARVVLTQGWLADKLEWPEAVKVIRVEEQGEREGREGIAIRPRQKATDLAYVIFTSGSTGVPKGVMIDHRAALNTVVDINERFGVGSRDRVLGLSSLSFDLSVYDVFGVLGAGGTLVLPGAEARRDPQEWLELLEREQVTMWNTVPALLEMLVEYVEGGKGKLPESLRLALLSGDWIAVTLPERVKKLQGGVKVVSLGGATEAAIWSILYEIGEVGREWKSIPYGRPMKNQSIHVLHENYTECPVWVPGQLYIGGVGLAQGYWRDEEKTAKRFVTHPGTGERLYETGDIGRCLPDGEIEFLGREDHQVKVQGHRIETGEIETILEQHGGVRQAVVAAVGAPRGPRKLVAYIVPKQEGSVATQTASGLILEESQRKQFKKSRPGLRTMENALDILDLKIDEKTDNIAGLKFAAVIKRFSRIAWISIT